MSGFCAAPRHPAPAPTARDMADIEAERYAIYSVFLNENFEDKPNKLLVIQNQTSKDNYLPEEWGSIKVEPSWQAAVDDYKTKNLKPSMIEDKFKVQTKVVLAPSEEIDRLFAEGGGWWQAFYKKYPHSPGLITFSNVGFNLEMTHALVDVSYSCGGLCGRGGLVLLVKKDGKWVKDEDLITWVS
jgi:hypothetical protein